MIAGRLPSLLSTALLLALCSSCIVRSVEPWLQDSSIVFEEDLLGGWVGKDASGSDVAMTFLRAEKGNAYDVQFIGKDGRGAFRGRLGKFGSDYYLDYRPAEGAQGIDGFMLFPTHSAARLEIGPDSLVVRPLDYPAMKAAAKLERLRGVKYVWDEADELVLISSTEDLQRFLVSLRRDSEYFSPPMRLTRKK
jgi:hypothetical protein